MRISDWSSDVCSSDLETMKENPENVQKFANAMQKACLWGHANPEGAAEVGAARFATADPKIIKDAAMRTIKQGAYPKGLIVSRDSYDNNFNRLQIGRANVGTPVTNAHLVCRPMLEKKTK